MATAAEGPSKLGVQRRERARLDFVAAQAFVDSIPRGRWTSYKEVARAAGAPGGAMAIGTWLLTGASTPNAWRVLNSRGEVSEGWAPASDDQPRTIDDVRDRLRGEGIDLDPRGRADPSKRWTAEEAGELGVALAMDRHPRPRPPDPATSFPSRITHRYLEQEVSGMGRDHLLALVAELRRRGWSEEEIENRALRFSPLQPPNRLPARITAAWLATNVPLLGPNRIRHLTAELRRRGWSSDEIRAHVFEHHQNGLAEEIPARIQLGWLERNTPLMTIAEQNRLAQIMLARGWAVEDVRHHLPHARSSNDAHGVS